MHSDLLVMSRDARDRIEAPPFPLAAIRAATGGPVRRPSRRRSIIAIFVTGFSIAAIAAAAEVTHQAHLTFLPSGGMVVSAGTAKFSSREIHSEADIQDATKQLDFQAIIPTGLPNGATPVKIDMAGTGLLVITYALADPHDGKGHKLWIFLANPATISQSAVAHYRSRHGYATEQWRLGTEQVIVVSDGLTKSEFGAIRNATERSASNP
ncbi:MAG TPA: hypothetical protein VGF98_08950 [Candidatus Tumulicola sp.]